jgi:hypothetical protein
MSENSANLVTLEAVLKSGGCSRKKLFLTDLDCSAGGWREKNWREKIGGKLENLVKKEKNIMKFGKVDYF